jgi:hypothetical protein
MADVPMRVEAEGPLPRHGRLARHALRRQALAVALIRQQIAVDTPVLSPDAEMKTFSWRRDTVWSSSPASPWSRIRLVDWDLEGRLWVIEMPGYMVDIRRRTSMRRRGRIVVLKDTNDDGKTDKRTVFADGLILRVRSALDAGVLVGEPPHLWLMRDTNGDLRADTKSLSNTYGRREASVDTETPTACTGRSTTGCTRPKSTCSCD